MWWMVLEGEAFGRWVGLKGGVLMNGISVLIRETPERSFAPSTIEDGKRQPSMNQEAGPH